MANSDQNCCHEFYGFFFDKYEFYGFVLFLCATLKGTYSSKKKKNTERNVKTSPKNLKLIKKKASLLFSFFVYKMFDSFSYSHIYIYIYY